MKHLYPERNDLTYHFKAFTESRLILLIPVLFFIVFYFPLLRGDHFFWEDVLKYHYPTLAYTVNSLKLGEIPLWNPGIFAGMPHLADLQVALFYPPNWILFFLRGVFPSSEIIYIWFILGHVLLMGLGIYKLGLNLGMNRISSVYASTVMMFSGYISLHVHHLNALYIMSWFPWAYLYFMKFLDRRNPKHLGAASLIFGISILAGYPQYTAIGLMILSFHTLYSVWKNRGRGMREAAFRFLALGLFIVLSIGLSLVQLLPTAELAAESVRASMSWKEAAHGSLSLSQLITLLAPGFFGQVTGPGGSTYWFHRATYLYWESAMFIGIIPLILLVFGPGHRDKRKTFFFFLAVGAVGLILAMGKNLPVYRLLFQLPGFNTFRIPLRYLSMFTFGLAMASAMSLDRLQSFQTKKGPPPKKRYRLGLVLSLLMIISLVSAALLIDIPRTFEKESHLSLALALLTLASAWVLIVWLRRSKASGLPALVITVVVFLELFHFGHGFAPGPVHIHQAYPHRGFMDRLKKKSQGSPFRLYYHRRPVKQARGHGILHDNFGSVYGVDTINGYNQLQLSRFSRFITQVESEKALQLLNVKYFLKVSGARIRPSPAPPWCPRFSLRSHLIPSESGRESLDLLNHGAFDPHTQAVVESAPRLEMDKTIPPSRLGTIRIVKSGSRLTVLEIEANHNCLLFASEIRYPGWKALLNGREVPIIPTNFLFRGVEIPPGRHRLTFVYTPRLLNLGMWISLFSLALMILLISGFVKKPHSPEAQ